MKSNRQPVPAAAALALLLLLLAPHAPASAAPRQEGKQSQKTGKQEKKEKSGQGGDAKRPRRAETDDVRLVESAAPADANAEPEGEPDRAEATYFKNFLGSYRLGPEDVISVKVFGLERYDKLNIIVPPDGKIDYYFVRGGLRVVGKTTQEVADEITKHLDEYIIEPQVTVSLDKAMSQRYYVVGDVAQPGIRVMSRPLSAYEAIIESGGVLATGDKKRVAVSRLKPDGMRDLTTVDIAAIEKSRAPDNYYLRPGDIVIVPGNRYKTVKKVLDLLPVISFARIFTGGF